MENMNFISFPREQKYTPVFGVWQVQGESSVDVCKFWLRSYGPAAWGT